MSIDRKQLTDFFDVYLQKDQYQDYCPNGLQIEGNQQIDHLVFAVSATKESIEYCIEQNAQALLVHHGAFWRYQGARTITGPWGKRIKKLIQHDINLIGYHLPLDGHPDVGNAAALAQELHLHNVSSFGEYKKMPIGVKGWLQHPMKPNEFKQELENILQHTVIHAEAYSSKEINSIGIITGGANNEWEQAYAEGLDAYITGEISEYNWHDAREADIHYFAGGHNATESFGIQYLMRYTQTHFKDKIKCSYFSSDNPA